MIDFFFFFDLYIVDVYISSSTTSDCLGSREADVCEVFMQYDTTQVQNVDVVNSSNDHNIVGIAEYTAVSGSTGAPET